MLRQNISEYRFPLYRPQKVRKLNFATQQHHVLLLRLVEAGLLHRSTLRARQVLEHADLVLFLKLAFKVFLTIVDVEGALVELFQDALPDVHVQVHLLREV